MTFLYQDPVSKETPPGSANRNWSRSFERGIQGQVFPILTLTGNIILIHETDLDKFLVRGGRVIPDEVFP